MYYNTRKQHGYTKWLRNSKQSTRANPSLFLYVNCIKYLTCLMQRPFRTYKLWFPWEYWNTTKNVQKITKKLLFKITTQNVQKLLRITTQNYYSSKFEFILFGSAWGAMKGHTSRNNIYVKKKENIARAKKWPPL